jgi:Gamma-glutamyl cyclotransferase, AIG2-like
MTSPPIAVFFYGFFMDVALLEQKGIHPTAVRRAAVHGFSIRIGHRATLVPDATGKVYGVVMNLSRDDVDRLYAEPSVLMYRPEAVSCELQNGERLPALCYTLACPPAPDERNDDYARQLRELAARLDLPADYIEQM